MLAVLFSVCVLALFLHICIYMSQIQINTVTKFNDSIRRSDEEGSNAPFIKTYTIPIMTHDEFFCRFSTFVNLECKADVTIKHIKYHFRQMHNIEQLREIRKIKVSKQFCNSVQRKLIFRINGNIDLPHDRFFCFEISSWLFSFVHQLLVFHGLNDMTAVDRVPLKVCHCHQVKKDESFSVSISGEFQSQSEMRSTIWLIYRRKLIKRNTRMEEKHTLHKVRTTCTVMIYGKMV